MKLLILEMLEALVSLGHDPFARIDARVYERRFKRKALKFGIRSATDTEPRRPRHE